MKPLLGNDKGGEILAEEISDEQKKCRYHLLDSIRGAMLISMIGYHLAWDLVYLYDVDWHWYGSRGAYWWQQSICWTFILLSGFCWQLGSRPLRRGAVVFGAGLLVTLVTGLFLPEQQICFGILTMTGSCMLLLIPLHKGLQRIHAWVGLLVAFCCFVLLRNVNRGYLGFEGWQLMALPRELYQGWFATYLGFPQAGFFSTDYFSLLPWWFLFLAGYFLFCCLQKQQRLPAIFELRVPLLNSLGKHSLVVYLIHQPLIYLGLMLIYHG